MPFSSWTHLYGCSKGSQPIAVSLLRGQPQQWFWVLSHMNTDSWGWCFLLSLLVFELQQWEFLECETPFPGQHSFVFLRMPHWHNDLFLSAVIQPTAKARSGQMRFQHLCDLETYLMVLGCIVFTFSEHLRIHFFYGLKYGLVRRVAFILFFTVKLRFWLGWTIPEQGRCSCFFLEIGCFWGGSIPVEDGTLQQVGLLTWLDSRWAWSSPSWIEGFRICFGSETFS